MLPRKRERTRGWEWGGGSHWSINVMLPELSQFTGMVINKKSSASDVRHQPNTRYHRFKCLCANLLLLTKPWTRSALITCPSRRETGEGGKDCLYLDETKKLQEDVWSRTRWFDVVAALFTCNGESTEWGKTTPLCSRLMPVVSPWISHLSTQAFLGFPDHSRSDK